jgi:ribosomal peptide maturation radical SAM protein 1
MRSQEGAIVMPGSTSGTASNTDGQKVCLVLMPFTPATTPSLGVGTLKSCLREKNLDVEVFHGTPEFFRYFLSDYPTDEAVRLYSTLATVYDVGELLFGGALWDDPVETELCRSWIKVLQSTLTGVGEYGALLGKFHDLYPYMGDYIEHCVRSRDWTQYDIVGFSSTFSQNVASLAMAKSLKGRYPHVHVVFGGANCSAEMGEQLIRSFEFIDAVIQGEADKTFPEYVLRRRAGLDTAGIAGLVYRQRGVVMAGPAAEPIGDMDSVPVPDYDDYFEAWDETGAEGIDVRRFPKFGLPVETSRGCWWGKVQHCVFCGLNPTTMSFREKSSNRAFSEFRTLRDRYGVSMFYAADNIISRKHLKELLPRLEGQNMAFFYETKSNLKEEEVAVMARAGLKEIQPGIESLSSSILQLMRKGVTGHQNLELLKWCRTYGLNVTWLYLCGFPNEPSEAYDEIIPLLRRLSHLPPPNGAIPIVLERFSPYFRAPEAFGFRNVQPIVAVNDYYRGVPPEERFNITSHFTFQLPQEKLTYLPELRIELYDWAQRFQAGAHFLQFRSSGVTLLVDARSKRRCFLLVGHGHTIHEFLRRAKRIREVEALLSTIRADVPNGPPHSERDLRLLEAGRRLGAEVIGSPADSTELPLFLAALDQRWITVSIDERILSLAVDCVDVDLAKRYELLEWTSFDWRSSKRSSDDGSGKAASSSGTAGRQWDLHPVP